MGMHWIADDPVPTTPTLRPEKSTPSCGHSPVWYVSPWNASSPSNAGVFAVERDPVAMMQN